MRSVRRGSRTRRCTAERVRVSFACEGSLFLNPTLMTNIQRVDGLLVETEGDGDEALLLIHGAITIDGCRPLLAQSILTERYRVIHYYRRGYGGSAAPRAGFRIADQAEDARVVLDALGVPRAHVLGHSIGAVIALQLAVDAPALVQSLALVEPTYLSRPGLEAWFQGAIAPVVAAYTAGDVALATDRMLRLIDGEDYRRMYEAAFTAGWFDVMVSALDLYFQVELPAAVLWGFPKKAPAAISQRVLVLNGTDTLPQFRMVADDLRTSIPQTSIEVVRGATHNTIASRPAESAVIVASFLAGSRVPMTKALTNG